MNVNKQYTSVGVITLCLSGCFSHLKKGKVMLQKDLDFCNLDGWISVLIILPFLAHLYKSYAGCPLDVGLL